MINQVRQLQKNGTVELYKDLQKLRQESQIDKLSKAFLNVEAIGRKLSIAFNEFFTTLFGNDQILDKISGALESITKMGIVLANKLLDNAQSIADGIARLINRFMNFVGEFKGLSLGQAMIKALAAPLALMADMITGAIVKGLKLGLPGFLSGGATVSQAQMMNCSNSNTIITKWRSINKHRNV